ncbi:MAG: ABC transporter permease [Bacteroidales bacterium]|jgi:ABC-2 type transport system permease protein|nr:ABC transporter permease [Bacteroidales bacterium]HOI32976.1 ABC transporter permease [Bacteroidales bacterium]
MKGFVIKEFLHIFRDFRTLLILFGMPIAQVLLFGFAITNEINHASIAVFDKARDSKSLELQQKLTASGYFDINMQLDNTKAIEKAFRSGKVKEVVVIPPQFGKTLDLGQQTTIQLINDASDPNTANLISSYTSAILRDFAADANPQSTLLPVATETTMLYNPELKGVFMFVPGTITVLLMLVSAMMTSISIAREKEMGTMEVLLISPLKPYQIILGKVLPYVVFSFVNASVILLMAYTIFEMPVNGSLMLLLAETLLFILMALAMGLFISTVSNSQQTAMLLSMFALMLPTILLSGFVFPVENMPLALQWLSHIMPSKWFIIIVKSIMLKGLGIAYIWQETLIILAMAVIFILLSIKKFEVRLNLK